MRIAVLIVITISLGPAWLSAAGAPCEPQWSNDIGQPGGDDGIDALAVFDDGGGPALYATGAFNTIGGVACNGIAKWDHKTSTWSPLGSGLNFDGGWAMAVYDSGAGEELYVGGFFTNAGGVTVSHIARWNGSNWANVGGGCNNSVEALAVFDDGLGGGPALYVGGVFTTAGGAPASAIAKWNGTNWSAVGSGFSGSPPCFIPTTPICSALAVADLGNGPALYAGGGFFTSSGTTLNHIAKWNPGSGTWSALGSGVSQGSCAVVHALAAFDDGNGEALYAGGSFDLAGGHNVYGIAKWNGAGWSALGTGMNDFGSNSVSALAVFDDGNGSALYAGGNFETAGGITVNRVAKWDGANWSALTSGTNGYVFALEPFDAGPAPVLYVAGSFSTAGGLPANDIAQWGCEVVPGDINGDGNVNVDDLLILLTAWGDCQKPCAADIAPPPDGDGTVNVDDLLVLLANWG